MQVVKTIGLDIAKSGFQVHGVDADGQVVFRRQLKRRYVLAFFQKVPSCLVGMEMCDIASLVARTAGAWAYGAADAAGLREALRQTADGHCAYRRLCGRLCAISHSPSGRKVLGFRL